MKKTDVKRKILLSYRKAKGTIIFAVFLAVLALTESKNPKNSLTCLLKRRKFEQESMSDDPNQTYL